MPHSDLTRASGQTRLNTLDIAKGICMIFVVFAHVNYTPELLVLIYSFHMPLFFILSGMVFNRDRYPTFLTFLKRRWKTLILPYLIYSVLAIVYVFVSERVSEFAVDLTREKYIRSLAQIFLAQGSKHVLNVPLWFVPCLFAVEILYFFISKLKPWLAVPVCVILAGLGWLLESGLLNFDNTLLPWTLDSALFALSFYATGNLAFPYVKKAIISIQNHRHKIAVCFAVILACAVLWLPLTLLNGKITLGSRVLNNGALLYLTGSLGTVLILAVSILADKCRFFRFLGRNTFTIMSLHYVIRRYTLPKYYAMFDIPMYDRKVLQETLIPFLIVFVLTVLITLCISRVKKAIARS